MLTCIANLSNDEVFTPPEFANRMLDTLAEAWAKDHGGANLWANKAVKFLDPCTKSGVFLRGHEFRLWLKDHLALYGVKNAVLAPGYRSPDKNKGEQ